MVQFCVMAVYDLPQCPKPHVFQVFIRNNCLIYYVIYVLEIVSEV